MSLKEVVMVSSHLAVTRDEIVDDAAISGTDAGRDPCGNKISHQARRYGRGQSPCSLLFGVLGCRSLGRS